MRRVLTIRVARAKASGGWSRSRSSSPSIRARGKSTPGGRAKRRALSVGSNIAGQQTFGVKASGIHKFTALIAVVFLASACLIHVLNRTGSGSGLIE